MPACALVRFRQRRVLQKLAKRGDHGAAWPDCVAAVESGRAGEDLIRWVGWVNQNPLPLLQG